MISIGVDLGQRRDPSTIAVIERPEWLAGQFHMTHPLHGTRWQTEGRDVGSQRLERGAMIVRYLERIKLGTPYSEVAKRVAQITRHPSLGNVRRRLLVDATGVGAPVIEMLREARPGCPLTGVTITSGSAAHSSGDREMVPRVDLLATMQAALEKGQLRILRGMKETDRLLKEMVSLGTGEHDDLVMAVALAAWGAKTGVMYGFRSEFLPVY
jgi:hypothetical protein